MKMNEEEKYELLNQYIEAIHAEQSTADLKVHDEEEAMLWAVARLLKVAVRPQAVTPSPSFASALEKRLIRQHQQTYHRRREMRPWWGRVHLRPTTLRGAGAIAALVTIVTILLALPLIMEPLTRKPFSLSLVAIAEAYSPLKGEPTLRGTLGDIEFELATSLPASPQRTRIYRQTVNPITRQEATELAQRLGIQSSAYRVGANWVAEDERSRLEIFSAQKGYYHYRNLKPATTRDVLVDATNVIGLAQHYLEERALLDFDHGSALLLAQPEDETASYYYQIFFPQIVGGLTIENAGVTVMVTKGGEVTEIRGRVLYLEPMGQQPLLSAKAAYHSLQSPGTRQTIWVEVNDREKAVLTQMVTRQLEVLTLPYPYQPGNYVELEGVLNATVFQDASGVISYTQAFLTPETCAPSLQLVGPRVDELASLDGYRVKVSGLISVDDSARPALIVETYRRTHAQEQAVVLLGSMEVEKEGDILLLRSPTGTRYALFRWCQSTPSLLTEYLNGAWSGGKILVRGILTGDQMAGKYPLVRIDQLHTGSEIEELESLTSDVISRLAPRPNVVPASIRVLSGQGYIEKVELILFALPLASDFQDAVIEPYRYLIPAYRFKGHLADGLTFTIYVQANPTGGQ